MIEPSADIINFQKRALSRGPFNETKIASFTTTNLIRSAKWVFFSNTLVAYWPFSARSSVSNSREKFLSFSFPSFGFFLSLLYIGFNIAYVVYYFLFRFSEERKTMQLFDLILMTIWDLLVVVGVTAHRVYGLIKLSKFQVFWDKIVSVVDQCTSLTCERDTELTLTYLRRWTIKWFVIFAVLGITDCLSVVYTSVVDTELVLTVFMYVYLEAVICMHNSSALMLIYFIKIITHGFATCKRKTEQLALTQSKSYKMHDTEGLRRNTSDSSRLITAASSALDPVFKLVEDLEDCVDNFNKLFCFSLFLEAITGFWQVMFAMFFLHENSIKNVAFTVNMLIPILIYPASLICLCVAASRMTVECRGMIQSFQRLSTNFISRDESYKIQLLVSRIAPAPPVIQVAQLFEVRESLLGSALNMLATYFVVLVQMKQFPK